MTQYMIWPQSPCPLPTLQSEASHSQARASLATGCATSGRRVCGLGLHILAVCNLVSVPLPHMPCLPHL